MSSTFESTYPRRGDTDILTLSMSLGSLALLLGSISYRRIRGENSVRIVTHHPCYFVIHPRVEVVDRGVEWNLVMVNLPVEMCGWLDTSGATGPCVNVVKRIWLMPSGEPDVSLSSCPLPYFVGLSARFPEFPMVKS